MEAEIVAESRADGNPAGDPVALALALLRFDTVSPPGAEADCAAYLARLLEAAGFDVKAHAFEPGRASLVARIAGRDAALAPLCFTGHLDTVPLGGRPWSVDPSGQVRDGRLHGRGAADMKSGVAAFVSAAIAARDRVRTGRRGLTLIVTAGEETGCRGALHLARIGALGAASALVVAEPTALRLGLAHKGALHLRARTRGATAHGSMPELGVNAVTAAASAIAALATFRFEVDPHPLLGMPSATVTSIVGGEAVNVVPDACAFTIDVRTLPGQDHAAILRALAGRMGPEVSIDPPLADLGPVGTASDAPFVLAVAAALVARGLPASPIGLPYFTDGSALQPALGCPTVILGPGEPGQAHQTDEWCALDDIGHATDLYGDIIARWCE